MRRFTNEKILKQMRECSSLRVSQETVQEMDRVLSLVLIRLVKSAERLAILRGGGTLRLRDLVIAEQNLLGDLID